MKIKIASDVCRTCFQEKANISIFDDKQLMTKLINVTQIEIENNGLPDKMCAECIEKLTFCYDFKMQCKLVDDRLQSFVQQIENKYDTFVKHQSSQLKNFEIPERKTVNNKSKKINDIYESDELAENPLHFEEVMINEIDGFGKNMETENTEINNVADIENESEIKEESISFEEFTFGENHSRCDNKNDVDKQQSSPAESTGQAIIKIKNKRSIASKSVNSNKNEAICFCAKTFSTRTNMRRHMRLIHDAKSEFKCDICKQEFGKKSLLESHMIKIHNMVDKHQLLQLRLLRNPKEIVCFICAKTFSRRPNLKRHIILVHENKKDFKCDICKEVFEEKSILKCHLMKRHLLVDIEKMIVDKQQLIQ